MFFKFILSKVVGVVKPNNAEFMKYGVLIAREAATISYDTYKTDIL